jgi:hypothetical protein
VASTRRWSRTWSRSDRHVSICETLDRYSHVSADMKQRAAAHFDMLLEEAKEDERTGTE